jgi:hypothetical protein
MPTNKTYHQEIIKYSVMYFGGFTTAKITSILLNVSLKQAFRYLNYLVEDGFLRCLDYSEPEFRKLYQASKQLCRSFKNPESNVRKPQSLTYIQTALRKNLFYATNYLPVGPIDKHFLGGQATSYYFFSPSLKSDLLLSLDKRIEVEHLPHRTWKGKDDTTTVKVVIEDFPLLNKTKQSLTIFRIKKNHTSFVKTIHHFFQDYGYLLEIIDIKLTLVIFTQDELDDAEIFFSQSDTTVFYRIRISSTEELEFYKPDGFTTQDSLSPDLSDSDKALVSTYLKQKNDLLKKGYCFINRYRDLAEIKEALSYKLISEDLREGVMP